MRRGAFRKMIIRFTGVLEPSSGASQCRRRRPAAAADQRNAGDLNDRVTGRIDAGGLDVDDTDQRLGLAQSMDQVVRPIRQGGRKAQSQLSGGRNPAACRIENGRHIEAMHVLCDTLEVEHGDAYHSQHFVAGAAREIHRGTGHLRQIQFRE